MQKTVSTEQDIIQLAHARSAALVHKDYATLDQLLLDNFCYTNASGIVLTKAEYFEHYVDSPHIIWTAQMMDGIAVTVYQHAAILTCRVHDQAQVGDQFYDNYYRSTFVWIEEQGVWRCVAGQTTETSPPG